MAADFEVADISLALISRVGVVRVGGCSTLWGDLRRFWDGQLLCQHYFLAGCSSLFPHLPLFQEVAEIKCEK